MSEFDAIRPYYDHEVQDVLTRIVASRELAQAASQLIMPSWLGQGSLGITSAATATEKVEGPQRGSRGRGSGKGAAALAAPPQ